MSSRVLLLTLDGQAAHDVVDPLQRRGVAISLAHDPGAALQRLGEHQLIILDARDAASLAMLCRRINDEAGITHPPILAVAHSSDVEARVRLLEAGADDVIARPIDERELEALVEALLLRASATTRAVVSGQAPFAPRPPSAPGRVIIFAAAKGGSGTTTLAVNTALVLAEMAPGSVAIADFDMYHGQVSTHLDIYARSSTASLAREDQESLADVVADAGRQHASGLTVFGGPYRPDDSADVTANQLIGLLDQLRSLYGTLVVDGGSTLDLRALGVLERGDRLAMVITPDIPALRLLHASLQILSEQGAAADRALFVVNHIYAKPMIGAEQIEEHLGIKIGQEIPYDGENFLKAVNEGQPLVNMAHRSPATGAIRRLAGQLTDVSITSEVVTPQKKRLLRGLLSRS